MSSLFNLGMLGGTVLLCALARLISTAKKHSVNFRERCLGDSFALAF